MEFEDFTTGPVTVNYALADAAEQGMLGDDSGAVVRGVSGAVVHFPFTSLDDPLRIAVMQVPIKPYNIPAYLGTDEIALEQIVDPVETAVMEELGHQGRRMLENIYSTFRQTGEPREFDYTSGLLSVKNRWGVHHPIFEKVSVLQRLLGTDIPASIVIDELRSPLKISRSVEWRDGDAYVVGANAGEALGKSLGLFQKYHLIDESIPSYAVHKPKQKEDFLQAR